MCDVMGWGGSRAAASGAKGCDNYKWASQNLEAFGSCSVNNCVYICIYM